jgi:diketogulonate reductase-like aldo/keto reductase
MSYTINSSVKLNNNVEMPYFGLGLYLAGSGNEPQDAAQWAFDAGYRHFDTAQIYGNEQDLGQALEALAIDRDEVFITTKVWRDNFGYAKTLKSVQESLKKLKLEYVDLFLLHWPVKGLRGESWRALEKVLDEGQARAIGVSNFMIWHLDELLPNCSVVPAVNQVEFSPYLYRKELLEYCIDKGIKLESYSPLTKARKLDDPPLVEIASKYNKTPAQILIRWVLEHDIIVIPKSTNEGRIKENAEVFDFSIKEEDMKVLNSMNIDLVTGWDPSKQD